MVTLQMHMRVFSLLFTIGVCGFLLSACAHESVAPTDQAVSVKAAPTQLAQDLLIIKGLRKGMSVQNENGAHYEIANEYFSASGAVCKRAIIRHNAPVTITGYAPQTPAKTLHACYKGDTAFLPAPKLKRDQR